MRAATATILQSRVENTSAEVEMIAQTTEEWIIPALARHILAMRLAEARSVSSDHSDASTSAPK